MGTIPMSLSKYEHAALNHVRFLAKQYGSDPIAFTHTLEVVKEGYRVDPYVRSGPIRWDTVISEAEKDEEWPFQRKVEREASWMKTTFHAKQ